MFLSAVTQAGLRVQKYVQGQDAQTNNMQLEQMPNILLFHLKWDKSKSSRTDSSKLSSGKVQQSTSVRLSMIIASFFLHIQDCYSSFLRFFFVPSFLSFSSFFSLSFFFFLFFLPAVTETSQQRRQTRLVEHRVVGLPPNQTPLSCQALR